MLLLLAERVVFLVLGILVPFLLGFVSGFLANGGSGRHQNTSGYGESESNTSLRSDHRISA